MGVGVPVQVPSVVDSVEPTTVVPEMTGTAVFSGAVGTVPITIPLPKPSSCVTLSIDQSSVAAVVL